MKALLDTHIILWALTNDYRLSPKAREIISHRDNEIWYSAASVWEVTVKHMNHPEHMPISGRQLSQYCQKARYQMLPVCDNHAYALETLQRAEGAPMHKDPFDRIMIAQAKVEGMSFVTHDLMLRDYLEDCIISV